ncbi:hypothetical protein RIF29_14153 [Crotalaria pallida]|uniref:DUF4378 domain-containing protein n=1 Tax=Crotalaria pallida TaxID=3830 RepID=A0AAN9FAY3_CROPI
MESKRETPSVILKLMGLDEVPPQLPVRDMQKVLSEKYLQKVASIGVRKKRSSRQYHSSSMSTDEMDASLDASKVVKTIRRDKNHNPSKGNGEENGVQDMLLDDASYMSDNGKPETLVDGISSFNFETSVNSWRMAEQGNLQPQLKTDNGLLEDVHGEAGLYETFRFSKSQLDQKDETLKSRSVALKANPGKGGNSLKYFSFPCSWRNTFLADGLLKEICYSKIARVYSEMKDRMTMSNNMGFGVENFNSFSEVSEEVSTQTGYVANKVLDTVSSSFFRENEAFANSSDMPKPASNVSVNEIQNNSPFFCSYGSYVGSETKNKTSGQMDFTEKLKVGQRHHVSTHHQLPMISEHGNEARNFSYQSGFSNDKSRRSIGCKVGVNYNIARKVKMARPLCSASFIADNHSTMTNDNLFRKYWGLRKNASGNWPTLNSKYRNINQNDCLEDMNHRSSSEKSLSFSAYFNSNHIEENCINLHKLKKRCYANNMSCKKPMLPQLSRSRPSPTFKDNHLLQETCLMNDEVKNYKHEDSNISKQNSVSPNSSVDWPVSDAKIEVVGKPYIYPTKQQSESIERTDSDSLNHSSYASTQQDTSECQEDSVCSLYSGTEPDSFSSFGEAYEPSPISVLELAFREDISSSSECLKVVGDGGYDSSEVDDEGLGLNVSSDEDCGDESVDDLKGKQELVGSFRAEESRDFSYVVEVLTEAGNANKSLFKDFSTWYSEECPISPSVFEILEKKFGEQQLWKRSERRLLFDRINLGLFKILQPCAYIPTWEKPLSRRLNPETSRDLLEEEMWGLLVAQEKEASKESEDKMVDGEIRWTELVDDIEDIVKEIVQFLIEELASEIVSLENL